MEKTCLSVEEDLEILCQSSEGEVLAVENADKMADKSSERSGCTVIAGRIIACLLAKTGNWTVVSSSWLMGRLYVVLEGGSKGALLISLYLCAGTNIPCVEGNTL